MKKPNRTVGYVVVEFADLHEQWLALEFADNIPEDGILAWPDPRPPVVFTTRREARAAIERTHNWGKAFDCSVPQKRNCKIVRVVWSTP